MQQIIHALRQNIPLPSGFRHLSSFNLTYVPAESFISPFRPVSVSSPLLTAPHPVSVCWTCLCTVPSLSGSLGWVSPPLAAAVSLHWHLRNREQVKNECHYFQLDHWNEFDVKLSSSIEGCKAEVFDLTNWRKWINPQNITQHYIM